MKLYLNGKEMFYKLLASDPIFDELILGEVFYGITNGLRPVKLIYKGWNSLHFIELPVNVGMDR